MANTTQSHATITHGRHDPQRLLSNIIIPKIREDMFWKEHLFACSAADMCEVVVEHVRSVGATYGGRRRPSKFLCCLLKLLQLAPSEKIIRAYMEQDEFKYLRCLGACYFRLTHDSKPNEIYEALEPYLTDNRRILKREVVSGVLESDYFVDTFVWELLFTPDFLSDIRFPFLATRTSLEEQGLLSSYESPLEDELEQLEMAENIKKDKEKEKEMEEKERVELEKRRIERENRRKERGSKKMGPMKENEIDYNMGDRMLMGPEKLDSAANLDKKDKESGRKDGKYKDHDEKNDKNKTGKSSTKKSGDHSNSSSDSSSSDEDDDDFFGAVKTREEEVKKAAEKEEKRKKKEAERAARKLRELEKHEKEMREKKERERQEMNLRRYDHRRDHRRGDSRRRVRDDSRESLDVNQNRRRREDSRDTEGRRGNYNRHGPGPGINNNYYRNYNNDHDHRRNLDGHGHKRREDSRRRRRDDHDINDDVDTEQQVDRWAEEDRREAEESLLKAKQQADLKLEKEKEKKVSRWDQKTKTVNSSDASRPKNPDLPSDDDEAQFGKVSRKKRDHAGSGTLNSDSDSDEARKKKKRKKESRRQREHDTTSNQSRNQINPENTMLFGNNSRNGHSNNANSSSSSSSHHNTGNMVTGPSGKQYSAEEAEEIRLDNEKRRKLGIKELKW